VLSRATMNEDRVNRVSTITCNLSINTISTPHLLKIISHFKI